MAEKLAPEKRHIFSHNGQTVFEWDQTLEEVNMYIKLPLNVHPKQFYCKIQSKHVEVGIRGNPPYLNHDLTSPVKTDCSFWTLEDDIMHITLQKRDKGQTWPSPIQGQGQLDPFASDMEQKRLMLQRFQEENPGFDFSQAQFTGNCPDPRTFMGGIRQSMLPLAATTIRASAIMVGIAGVPADTVMKKTKKIEDDWTPVWDQECSLPLTVPEPSIRFRAKVHQFVFGVLSTVLSSLE